MTAAVEARLSTTGSSPRPVPSVSVILPTFNEAGNIEEAVDRIRRALAVFPDHEILVVDDDSPDATWEVVDALTAVDPRVRCLRRLRERGLASAIVDGLRLGRGEALVVMDADLQHDPAVLPRLIAALRDAEVAVASRYAAGGSVGHWGRRRRWSSRAATAACRWTLGLRVSDPMSGFFAIRRTVFDRVAPRLRPRGYKALMEILYRLRGACVTEVPYVFGRRFSGDSKLGAGVILDYCLALVELRAGRSLRTPVRRAG